MRSKFTLLLSVLSLLMALSLLTTVVTAAPGDNLWISNAAWGPLIDPAGAPVLAKGDRISIPVTLTSSQGTVLVTTPGAGATDDDKSMPELDGATGLYKNVVYIDTVSAPASGNTINYSFGFDPALLTKGETLYVKVGGTDLAAGEHQKATTTYLGAVKPEGSYTAAVDGNNNLVITTPSTTLAAPAAEAWAEPKVTLTISEGSAQREITAGITVTDTAITVPKSALVSAFADLPLSEITITGILINDSVIENTTLDGQNITVAITNPAPNYGDISGDGIIDISDVIMAMEIAVGYPDDYDHNYYTADRVIRANVSDKLDPMVNISDVILIAERATGDETPFPVELP